MKQVELLKNAMKNNYIVPAFNFANFDILKGLLEAIEETNSPAILQVSESAMNYFGDSLLRAIIQSIKQDYSNISFHLDHGKSFEVVKRAIKLGFDSIMIDGSMLNFENNVALTKNVVDYAHKHNVAVEGEIGALLKPFDDSQTDAEMRFTNPKEAKEFVSLTGVDSIAISIGTNHGINKNCANSSLRLDILKEIENEIPNIPLVLHGASLIDEKYIKIINDCYGKISKSSSNRFEDLTTTNICKINMDTDFRLAFTAGVRCYMKNKPETYCPREIGKSGINFVKECAIDRILNVCKSQNKN